MVNPPRVAEKAMAYVNLIIENSGRTVNAPRHDSSMSLIKWVPPPTDAVTVNVNVVLFEVSGSWRGDLELQCRLLAGLPWAH